MYSMSVRCNYSRQHLIWAAYMLLQDKDHLKYCPFPSGLSKKIIRDYLRDQMSMFGMDDYSLFGSDYVDRGPENKTAYNKAKKWVENRNWDK